MSSIDVEKLHKAKIEQLREKITKSFNHYAVSFEVDGRYSPRQWVEEVFQAFIDAGGVLLAENQELPKFPYHTCGATDTTDHSDSGKCIACIKEEVVIDIQNNHWQRIIKIKLIDLEEKDAG